MSIHIFISSVQWEFAEERKMLAAAEQKYDTAEECHKYRSIFKNPQMETGLLEMTIPEKPTSFFQKYRSTEAGIQFLAHNSGVQNEK